MLAALAEAGYKVTFITTEADPLPELNALSNADAVIIASTHPNAERTAKTLAKVRADGSYAPIVWLARSDAAPFVLDVVHDPPDRDELRLLAWMTSAERSRRAERDARREAGDAHHLSDLGRVVTQVAHEIRNPLTALSAKLQWLKRKASNEPQITTMSASLLDEVDRLSRMLSEVLEYGRSRTYSRRTTAEVAQTLKEVVALYRETAEAAHVQLVLDAEDSARVPYPSEELHQVFQNLLANAIDATPPDETIRIAVRKREGKLDVEFRNPGHLQEETLAQIFELFFTTKPNGTGLGLPIVKRIVRGAEGDIQALNDGADVVFRVTLPLSA
ncbi:MAG: GHKL domain-containing protein [Deltaproteobacteria bacterium]|nr:GHKL domain-containing protein [Deltaproteobacteria bacterium]